MENYKRPVNSVQDMLLDIYTLQCEQSQDNGYYDEAHVQNSFEIIWMQDGMGFHEVNTVRYQLKANNIYCAMPGQLHHLKISPGSKGYLICFNQSFLNGNEPFCEVHHTGLFPLLSQSAGISLDSGIAGDMLEIVSKMCKEFNNNNVLLSTGLLQRYLKIFLIYLIRQFTSVQPDGLNLKDVNLYKKFTALLEENFKAKKMVRDYASELFITANYLNECIRKTSGYPASYHISQRVVQEAKRRALYSGNTLKEIAYDLGFDDVAHFSKYFKKVSGKNFTEFRNQPFALCA
jgi:YesN/AraC family two-component response regulator